MSNTKNLFDDFLERKMQEKVFEEKDSYWEQARMLIDTDRKKLRRKKIFFWTGFSTVFCSTLVLSILLLDPAESTNNKQVATIAPTGITAVTSPATATPENSAPVYAIEGSASPVLQETTTPVNDVRVAGINHIVSHPAQPVTAPAKPATAEPVESTEATNNIPVAAAPISGVSKKASKTNASTRNKHINNIKQATADISTAQEAAEVAAEPKEAPMPQAVSKFVVSATAPEGSQPSMPVNAKHEDVQQITYSMPSLLALIPDSSYTEKNIIIRPPVSYTTPLYVSLEAGITHYNAKGIFASEQTGAYAALNYTRFISSRIGFGGGIGFSMLKQNLNRSYVVKEYGFGEKVSRTSIRTMELDYLEIPLKMYYNVGGRHYLHAGATFAYLLQSQDRLVNPSEGKQDTRTSGFTKAILPYDVQLSVGYAVSFGERFMLNASYYYGLSDVSKNNLFRSQATDRNEGYRLGVSYKLF